MNALLPAISGTGTLRLGWALIHSLWQGLIIALLLEIALGLVGRKNASLRYFMCCLALAGFPFVVAITYVMSDPQPYPQVSPVTPSTTLSVPANPTQAAPSPLASPSIRSVTEFPSYDIGELNRFMPAVVAAWLIGVLLLTGRKAGGFLLLWHLKRRGVSAPDDVMSELFQQACANLGVDPIQVCLKISAFAQVPMTMGWIRPVILFPAALLTGLSTSEIELLLAHELAHIRRHDYLANLLQTVVETLLFYHPVTWWISSRLRQERENRCDDLVTSRSGDVLAYANVLLHLESMRADGALLASAANGGDLLQRVRRLLGEPAPPFGVGLPTLFSLLTILAVIAASSLWVKAQAPVASPVPATPEAAFAQPITVKEMPIAGPSTTRVFYQGGEIILQQTVNMSPGSIGQIVFYKHVPVVDDRRGTKPIAFSSTEILPNDFKVRVQFTAADDVSPANLRILDSHDQIITEFFIDPTGLMRPITKAEHDADLARRKAAFSAMAPSNNPITTDDSFIIKPKDGSGDALLRKLKSLVIDKVDFRSVDVAAALEFLTKKSQEIDPDKKGVGFVLADLSHLTPSDHVHREFTVVLENVPLDEVLGYICSQTNLKCSIEANTVYFKGPSQQNNNISIIHASYEAADGSGAKDVTGTLTAMLKDNHLEVSVENDVFGGDPAWLHVKPRPEGVATTV
jgi:beta-lactamase regulating signal transducer with metallopeptidase domain